MIFILAGSGALQPLSKQMPEAQHENDEAGHPDERIYGGFPVHFSAPYEQKVLNAL
jgi:hypothetical protein